MWRKRRLPEAELIGSTLMFLTSRHCPHVQHAPFCPSGQCVVATGMERVVPCPVRHAGARGREAKAGVSVGLGCCTEPKLGA